MIVKLLTEHHLEFLSLKGGCTGLSESTLVKMSHCWKSRALAHILPMSPIAGCISLSLELKGNVLSKLVTYVTIFVGNTCGPTNRFILAINMINI